jgi:hypothetical protein
MYELITAIPYLIKMIYNIYLSFLGRSPKVSGRVLSVTHKHTHTHTHTHTE